MDLTILHDTICILYCIKTLSPTWNILVFTDLSYDSILSFAFGKLVCLVLLYAQLVNIALTRHNNYIAILWVNQKY